MFPSDFAGHGMVDGGVAPLALNGAGSKFVYTFLKRDGAAHAVVILPDVLRRKSVSMSKCTHEVLRTPEALSIDKVPHRNAGPGDEFAGGGTQAYMTYSSDMKGFYKAKTGTVFRLYSMDRIAATGNTICIKEGRPHWTQSTRNGLKLVGQLPLDGFGG